MAVPCLHVLDAQPGLVERLPGTAAPAILRLRVVVLQLRVLLLLRVVLLLGGGGAAAGALLRRRLLGLHRVLQLLLGFQLRHDLRRHIAQLVLPVRIGALVTVRAGTRAPPGSRGKQGEQGMHCSARLRWR